VAVVLEEPIQLWLGEHSPKTAYIYHLVLKQFLVGARLGGVGELLRLDSEEVIRRARLYALEVDGKGYHSHAQTVKKVVRSFMKSCGREIRDNRLKIRRVPRSAKTLNRLVPSKEEVARIVEHAATNRHKALLLLLFHSGLRIGTVLQLLVGEVKKALEGAPPHRLIVDPNRDKQSNKEPYYVFFDAEAAKALSDYLTERPRVLEGDLLFPVSKVACWKAVKSCAKRAGFDPKAIWPHCFRAAYYNMLVGEMDEPEREFLMGHIAGTHQAYFAPQWVERLREKYGAVGFNYVKVVKVASPEVAVLRERLTVLEEELARQRGFEEYVRQRLREKTT
jgi:integrase